MTRIDTHIAQHKAMRLSLGQVVAQSRENLDIDQVRMDTQEFLDLHRNRAKELADEINRLQRCFRVVRAAVSHPQLGDRAHLSMSPLEIAIQAMIDRALAGERL